MPKEQSNIVIHDIVMLTAAQLSEHPKNKNKQSKHTHSEIKKSIQENGFDENLIVVPREDGSGYYIAHGNHKYRAGKSLGMKEFPCVIHKDWDSAKQQIELLRRNLIRGATSKEDFTVAVTVLEEESQMDLPTISEKLGFESDDAFARMFQEERQVDEAVERETGNSISQIAQKAKITEDLGLIISALLEKYGDTVPNSFVIFPSGGKQHIFIQSTPTLRRILEVVTGKCVHDGMDVNVALGGLLSIGMHHSNFKAPESNNELIKKEGTEVGSSDISALKKDEE